MNYQTSSNNYSQMWNPYYNECMHFPRHNVSHPWPEMVFLLHRHWIYIYIRYIYSSYIQINNYFLQFRFQYLSRALYGFAISTFKEKKKRLWSKIPPRIDHKHSTQIFLTCFIGLMACCYLFIYFLLSLRMGNMMVSNFFFFPNIN